MNEMCEYISNIFIIQLKQKFKSLLFNEFEMESNDNILLFKDFLNLHIRLMCIKGFMIKCTNNML